MRSHDYEVSVAISQSYFVLLEHWLQSLREIRELINSLFFTKGIKLNVRVVSSCSIPLSFQR